MAPCSKTGQLKILKFEVFLLYKSQSKLGKRGEAEGAEGVTDEGVRFLTEMQASRQCN